ncbi:MAG: hypothetical protein PUF45_09670 [Lachnospiraceae bacterium]|nr:hypothetical protein [Lachnospiraceae bacterium]
MSRKGLSGQLSMFDFWGAQAGAGEVEMVSLMPEPEEQVEKPPKTTKKVPVKVEAEVAPDDVPVEVEAETMDDAPVESEPEVPGDASVEVEAEVETDDIPVMPVAKMPEGDSPVMHSEKRDSRGKVLAEISYLNYNKVFLRREGEEGETFQFDNSKEAVDFYIAEMLKLGCGDE